MRLGGGDENWAFALKLLAVGGMMFFQVAVREAGDTVGERCN